MSVKFVSAILGRKCLRQFYGHLEFLRSFCRKTVSIKFLVLGGGYFGFGGGGVEWRFYFYGRGDFSDKWGLRPLSAICAQSSTIVHFCGPFGRLSKGKFRRKMTTVVGNRGQLWTSHKHLLSPHLLSPHFKTFQNRGVSQLHCRLPRCNGPLGGRQFCCETFSQGPLGSHMTRDGG